MNQFIIFLLAGFLFFSPALAAVKTSAPQIALANIYHQDIDVTKYLVSEKLDGVRAYWDGKNLISREGTIFNAPNWFTADFPKDHLEGELWIGRGKFEIVSGIVRSENDDNQNWQQVRLMLFDLPKHSGVFSERLEAMKNLVKKSNSKYLQIINQYRISDRKSLMKELQKIIKIGGEGLMLHKADSLYKAERSDDIIKLKAYEDAEAKIIAIVPGKGKYQGKMGAVLVTNEQGINFKIGGGFSDEQRQNPPKIGTIITYKFFGKTKDGKPRFASFMRIREDHEFKIIKKSKPPN